MFMLGSMIIWLVHNLVSVTLSWCRWSRVGMRTRSRAAAQIAGGHVAMDDGTPTPPQLHEDEEDAAFGGLFAE